jgi:hypothetical protein
MAGVLSITFYDCTENTYTPSSMAVYINGTEVLEFCECLNW